jgi:hypothetical protein
MEENQTNKDYLNSSLVFAKALGLVFEEGQGVVVDVTNDIDFGEDVKKVFVFALNGMIHIQKCEEDLPEGTPVLLNTGEEEKPQEEPEN